MPKLKDLIYRIVVDDKEAIQKVASFEQRARTLATTARLVGKGAQSAFNQIARIGEKVFFTFEGLQILSGPQNEVTRQADAFNAAARKLEATAKLTGNSFEFLKSTATAVKTQFSLNTIQANEFTIALTKLTQKAGDTSKTGDAIARLLDIAAAQGLNADKALTAVNQAILGIDEGTDKLFQKNPSVIYAEYAKQIGTTAGKLTDQQKAQALLNEVLTQGIKVQGEYNKFLASDAGRKATAAARTAELQAKIGDLVNKALVPLLEAGVPVLAFFTRLSDTVKVGTVALGGLILTASKLVPVLASLGFGLGPIGIVLGALAAAAGLLTYKFNETQKSGEELSRLSFTALTNELGRLNEKQVLSNAEQARRNELIVILQREYPAYLKNIDLEKVKAAELRDVQRQVNAEIRTRIAIRAAEEEVAEALEKVTAAERDLQTAIREQANAQEIARQAAQKRIDAESGIEILTSEQKRAALNFLKEIDRAGNLSEASRAEQINRALDLTAEYYQFEQRRLSETVDYSRQARDTQLKDYQQFLNHLNNLTGKITGGQQTTETKSTLTTETRDNKSSKSTTEKINIERRLKELRIQNISDTFERRRQSITLEIDAEIDKLESVENANVVHSAAIVELQKRKATQLAAIDREEIAQKEKLARELTRLQIQSMGDEFSQRRALLDLWYAEEQSKHTGQTEALEVLAKIRADRLAKIETDAREVRLQQFAKDNTLLLGSLEAGYDSLFASLTDTAIKGSERMKQIWQNMSAFFLRTVGEMLKADIAASLKAALVHKQAEGAKTAATTSGIATRVGAVLAGLAAEVGAVLKSIGVFLSQAAAKLVAFFAGLGPLGLVAGLASIPALIAAARGLIKSVGFFAEGGIVSGPTLGILGEAGSPEAAIPLNARGADFIAQLIPKITVVAPQSNIEFRRLARDIAAEVGKVRIEFHNLLEGQQFLRKEAPIFNRQQSDLTL